jgi:N-terminal half of MaoC dehydratase
MAVLDRSVIGREFPPSYATVEASAALRFAQAIGETNEVFLDELSARTQGYRGLCVPPTYAFVLKHQGASPDAALRELGVEGGSGKLLHAEQAFEYLRPICAGDRLCFRERVADVYEKKGGALLFIVLETRVTDELERLVAVIRHTEVIRRDL